MASSAPNKVLIARIAAILTAGEVAGADLDLNEAWASSVVVELDFTKGSLTNGIVRFYASMDGVTYYPVYDGGVAVTETLLADAARAYVMPPLSGYKKFRASLQGTGATAGSSAALRYRYLRRGSQG